jgi:hypothetical protein
MKGLSTRHSPAQPASIVKLSPSTKVWTDPSAPVRVTWPRITEQNSSPK